MRFYSLNGDVQCAGRLGTVASMRFFDVRVSSCETGTTPVGQGYGKVDLVLDGEMVISQDGRRVVVGAGELAFRDGTRSSRVVVADDVRMVGLILPLAMISVPRRALTGLTATRMDGAAGSGALLSSFLTTLGANLESLRPQEEAGLSAAAGDLLTAALAHAAEAGAAVAGDAARSALLRRIRYFVETEISDPRLSPASIAAAHHISVRQLHRLFEDEDTTVGELVRTLRLAGCRRDLADPGLGHLSIGAVAARWGILDSAKFSRIFRAAHGLSPRQYRARNGGCGAHRRNCVG
ncbi:helix-turn-helix domain-containing protein [Lentzea sp. NPDC004789]